MAIVSVSIDENLLNEIDEIAKNFSGRSELIRLALHNLLLENKSVEKLSGKSECILLLVHEQAAEAAVTKIKHDFEDIVKTQIHNNLSGDKCLEIFVLSGHAARIREMHEKFQKSRRIDYAKLVVS